jgi:hypothetical protein
VHYSAAHLGVQSNLMKLKYETQCFEIGMQPFNEHLINLIQVSFFSSNCNVARGHTHSQGSSQFLVK